MLYHSPHVKINASNNFIFFRWYFDFYGKITIQRNAFQKSSQKKQFPENSFRN